MRKFSLEMFKLDGAEIRNAWIINCVVPSLGKDLFKLCLYVQRFLESYHYDPLRTKVF